jgi:hypothetical protein
MGFDPWLMRFLCSLVDIVMEALNLTTLKLGDPEAYPQLGCADQRCKRQFQHQSFFEEGAGRLGTPAFLPCARSAPGRAHLLNDGSVTESVTDPDFKEPLNS